MVLAILYEWFRHDENAILYLERSTILLAVYKCFLQNLSNVDPVVFKAVCLYDVVFWIMFKTGKMSLRDLNTDTSILN